MLQTACYKKTGKFRSIYGQQDLRATHSLANPATVDLVGMSRDVARSIRKQPLDKVGDLLGVSRTAKSNNLSKIGGSGSLCGVSLPNHGSIDRTTASALVIKYEVRGPKKA
jgi:hypothetical protein